MSQKHIIWKPDELPEWCVVIEFENGHHWADFWLLQAGSWTSANNGANYDQPWFVKIPGPDGPEKMTQSPEEAIELGEVAVQGYLKWDGCNECRFDDHYCDGSNSIRKLAAAWVWAMDECRRLMLEAGQHVDWEPKA